MHAMDDKSPGTHNCYCAVLFKAGGLDRKPLKAQRMRSYS